MMFLCYHSKITNLFIFANQTKESFNMADQSLACTYAVLMLQGSGNCDEASILAVTKAAGEFV